VGPHPLAGHHPIRPADGTLTGTEFAVTDARGEEVGVHVRRHDGQWRARAGGLRVERPKFVLLGRCRVTSEGHPLLYDAEERANQGWRSRRQEKRAGRGRRPPNPVLQPTGPA
jgi:hypothetical protein